MKTLLKFHTHSSKLSLIILLKTVHTESYLIVKTIHYMHSFTYIISIFLETPMEDTETEKIRSKLSLIILLKTVHTESYLIVKTIHYMHSFTYYFYIFRNTNGRY